MSISLESVARTRLHFARLAVACMRDAFNGVDRVADLPAYIAWRREQLRASLAGECDHSFTFRQMAHFFETGECIALLA